MTVALLRWAGDMRALNKTGAESLATVTGTLQQAEDALAPILRVNIRWDVAAAATHVSIVELGLLYNIRGLTLVASDIIDIEAEVDVYSLAYKYRGNITVIPTGTSRPVVEHEPHMYDVRGEGVEYDPVPSVWSAVDAVQMPPAVMGELPVSVVADCALNVSDGVITNVSDGVSNTEEVADNVQDGV